MAKLIWIVGLACGFYRLTLGFWPWQKQHQARISQIQQARSLLGVTASASREDIEAAHRARLVQVHPDRGGSTELVYAADQARDILLSQLNHPN